MLLVGVEFDPRESLIPAAAKLSLVAGLGLSVHRMSNVSMLKYPRTSTIGTNQQPGIQPFDPASGAHFLLTLLSYFHFFIS